MKIYVGATMACGRGPNPPFEHITERASDLRVVTAQYAPRTIITEAF